MDILNSFAFQRVLEISRRDGFVEGVSDGVEALEDMDEDSDPLNFLIKQEEKILLKNPRISIKQLKTELDFAIAHSL